MKLKFRAEHKDVVTFLWACLLLLIVVAICVRNFYHIAQEGVVGAQNVGWTFNFIPAFFPPYLLYTLIFWILAVVLLTVSVSSHFFSREKGFGLIQGKKDDGFGRFAKEDEYKKYKDVEPVEMKAKEATAAGFPLVYDKKKNLVYVDNGESHSLVIGATGSGKTQSVVLPMVNLLAKKGESMIITDPKGEIYTNQAEMLRDKGYDVIVVNFRDPKNGSCWNPYTLPYKYYKEGNQDKANELLNDMAINIATDEKADDPFWTNSASDYLTGLSLAMFEDAKEEEISISTVNLMMTVGDEKLGASTYLKEYFKFKDPASPAAINALGTINAPQDTRNSIESVLKQKIKVFAVTQNLAEMLSRSDFDMETIGARKTAVFMIIQDEKTTYHALATIFVKQCYESLIAVAQKNGGKLPVRTNFIIDEFQNMPKFKDITTMITAARSRQIRMTMIIQNFAGLVQTYGKEDAETIRGNCGDMLYLLTGELSALEEISKLCGDKIVKVGKDKKEETRPLITVTELQRFKQDEVLILKHRLPPLRTKVTPYWNTDYGYGKDGENIQKASLPTHEQQPIKLFDIREFVKKQKEEKRNELFGSTNPFENNNPFGEDRMSNPFGGQPQGFNPFASMQQSHAPSTKPSFDSFQNPISKNEPNEDELDIDSIIKKIDAKMLELEKEEENDKKIQEQTQDVINKEVKNDNVLSSDVIMPSSKINFPSNTNDIKKSDDYDMIDDFMEDISSNEKEETVLPEVKQVSDVQDNEDDKIYTNKEEINKIMNSNDNKKDDEEDLFDDFFE